jgi:hypothetical protein
MVSVKRSGLSSASKLERVEFVYEQLLPHSAGAVAAAPTLPGKRLRQVLDREGKPLAGAQVTYTLIGVIDRNYQASAGMRTESPKMMEKNGRAFTVKTDKKGAFALVGMDYGVYDVEITGPDGEHVYSGKSRLATKQIQARKTF